MKRLILSLLIINLTEIFSSGQTVNLNDSITLYFQEIRTAAEQKKDLWNLDLYAPILLVDPSRKIYANYPDSAGMLKKEGEIYTGLLPDNINISNTAVHWSGRSWAMIRFPLPEKKPDRLDLLSHELFHRSQPALGFHMRNSDNDHLDQKDGRLYLRLELEALRQALISKTHSESTDHLADAIYFRKTRYSIFPEASSTENLLELNEGLASYTGTMMTGKNDAGTVDYLQQKISEFLEFPTFVRSFAYITTPLYGFILSRTDKKWNRQITDTTNLTDFFIKAFGLSVPENLCHECMSHYGFEKILQEETARELEKRERLALYEKIFIEDPHFEIRFENMNISFDPGNIIPFKDNGSVYPTMRVSDNWGILTVTGGALLSKNWDKVTLSEPTLIKPDSISGSGWQLKLNRGYQVKKNIADKNFSLSKIKE